MDSALQLTNVVRNDQLGKTVVQAARGVSLEFQRGEFTALAGASGSGKTTLLNIIGCIDKPDSGRIELMASLNVSRRVTFIFSTHDTHKHTHRANRRPVEGEGWCRGGEEGR